MTTNTGSKPELTVTPTAYPSLQNVKSSKAEKWMVFLKFIEVLTLIVCAAFLGILAINVLYLANYVGGVTGTRYGPINEILDRTAASMEKTARYTSSLVDYVRVLAQAA